MIAVAGAGAQVVQVPHRDRADPLEACIAEDIALAAQHTRRGRTRQRAHGALDLGESLLEAERELGLADWVDPDTGEPAEDTHTRIEDH